MMKTRSAARHGVVLCAAAALLAGCGTANTAKTAAAHRTGGSGSGAMNGMNMGGSSSSGSMDMSGNSGSGSTTSGMSKSTMSVDGITPIPTQVLGTATWQGMKITARAMTAVPFVIFNGTSMKTVKPGPHTSFHLMVDLSDAETNVAIPYASVWATISKDAKVVFDERQWPMLSRYMGPHYGNNVSVPGAGTYTLSLLVSPPEAARHMEYADVWTHPHRVSFTFHWKPVS